MAERLCPFGAPLVKHDFGCRYANEIIRRGGAEIACEQEEAYSRCVSLHATIKQSSLLAMGHNDDLLTLPHNVLVKIQYGGLLALQSLTGNNSAEQGRIEDISLLVAMAVEAFKGLEKLPLDRINDAIVAYKTQRRGKNRS